MPEELPSALGHVAIPVLSVHHWVPLGLGSRALDLHAIQMYNNSVESTKVKFKSGYDMRRECQEWRGGIPGRPLSQHRAEIEGGACATVPARSALPILAVPILGDPLFFGLAVVRKQIGARGSMYCTEGAASGVVQASGMGDWCPAALAARAARGSGDKQMMIGAGEAHGVSQPAIRAGMEGAMAGCRCWRPAP